MAAGTSMQDGGGVAVAGPNFTFSGLQEERNILEARSCLRVVQVKAVGAVSLCMEVEAQAMQGGMCRWRRAAARLIGGTMSTGGSLAVSSGAGGAGGELDLAAGSTQVTRTVAK